MLIQNLFKYFTVDFYYATVKCINIHLHVGILLLSLTVVKHELPSIAKVIDLANKLEMCEFREFWVCISSFGLTLFFVCEIFLSL